MQRACCRVMPREARVVKAVRRQQIDEGEQKLEYAILELTAALDALRHAFADAESLKRAILAHQRIGAANDRLVKLLGEELTQAGGQTRKDGKRTL